MNERIENTYTRSGRIANPTEQENVYNGTFSDVFPKEKWSFQKSSDLFPTISDPC